MIEVRVPRVFYDDHRCRDLPTPAALRKTKRHVYIDLEDHAVAELCSDAYSYATSGYGFEFAGLASSARATTRALRAGFIAAAKHGSIASIPSRVVDFADIPIEALSEHGWVASECGCLKRRAL